MSGRMDTFFEVEKQDQHQGVKTQCLKCKLQLRVAVKFLYKIRKGFHLPLPILSFRDVRGLRRNI